MKTATPSKQRFSETVRATRGDVFPPYVKYYDWWVNTSFEKIDSWSGPWPYKKQWKPCTHLKWEMHQVPVNLYSVHPVGNPSLTFDALGINFTSAESIINVILSKLNHSYLEFNLRDEARAFIKPMDLNSYMFFAELRETIALFKAPRKFLKNAWTSFQKKPITRRQKVRLSANVRKNVGKWAADKYLTAKFGVEPLAKDLADIATLYDQLVAKWKHLQVQAGRQEDFNKTNIHAFDFTEIIDMGIWQLKLEASVVHTRKTGVMLTARPPNVPFPPIQFILNVIQAVPTAKTLWELIPGSFVADWFTNTGDVLDDIDGQGLWLDIEHHSRGSSSKFVVDYRVTCVADNAFVGQPLKDQKTITGSLTSYSRKTEVEFVNFSLKRFQFENPFKKKSDAGKGATLLALAIQKRK